MFSAHGRLRVATFTSLFPNAQQPFHGTFVWARINALKSLADIRVVAPVPWIPPVSWFGDRYYRYSQVARFESREGIDVIHPRFFVIPKILKALDGLFMGISTIAAMRKLRRTFDFDLIDAHWAYPDGLAAAVLAKFIRVPLAITVRGDDINVFPKSFWRRQNIRWAVKNADIVIALSEELGQGVEKLGVSREKIVVIPNGVDAEQFSFGDLAGARRRLGLSETTPVLLSVGRLHHSKGFPILVEALGLLRDEFADLTLVIAGSSDPEADAEPAIREMARRYNIEDRVRLIGPQPPSELVDWYNAADLFGFASEREGSANVLLEALACGLPCIATPVGGNSEIVSRPDFGILVKAEPRAMAEAIRSALRRPWDRKKISTHMQSRTWTNVAKDHYSQLSMIAGRNELQVEFQG